MILKWLKNTSGTIPTKYHILFWLSYFTFNVIRWGSYFDDYWYSLKSNLVEFPLHILLVYFNIYFLIPRFILTKKYKSYITLFIFSLFIIYVLRTGLNYFLVTKNIWPEAETPQQAFTFNHIIAVTLGEIYVVALATSIKLAFDWIYERNRFEKLRKIQLRTELNFLKSQIQPHFFFNTLNNLTFPDLFSNQHLQFISTLVQQMGQYHAGFIGFILQDVINLILHLQQTLLQPMLKRCLADAALTVEQDAVVVDRLEDAAQQLFPADEDVIPQNRGSGDIGIEYIVHNIVLILVKSGQIK